MPGSRMFTRRGLAKGAFIAALVVLGLPALFTFQQYPDLLLFLVFLAAVLPLAVAWGLGPAGTAVVAVGAVAIAAALYLALRSRARPGGLSVAALAAYAVVMGWAALFCLTVLGFGLGLRYEDYCLDGPNGRIELDRLPPSVACIYEYADGRIERRSHDGDLYAMFAVWFAYTCAAIACVHIALTHLWRRRHRKASLVGV